MMLGRVDAGFTPAGVLTFQISAAFGEERSYDLTVQRINRTLDALRELPRVNATATSVNLPVVNQFPNNVTIVEDRRQVSVDFRTVSPGYFETLRIPVVAGDLCRRPADPQGVGEIYTVRTSQAELPEVMVDVPVSPAAPLRRRQPAEDRV